MSALEAAIDELYRQPLNEFTAARNALAKTLSGADAKRVRALSKPTIVAWAVNQVYWHARPTYDRLRKAGDSLRTAQIAALEGKSVDVRAATDAHRRAVSEAVAEAERLAASAGSKPGSDALARTFESLSLAAELPEPPGGLTEALQPAGFEALAGITPQKAPAGKAASHLAPAKAVHHETLAPTRHRTAAGGAKAAREAAEREKREREEARRREAEEKARAEEARKREADLAKANALVARAESTEKLARAAWEHAHDALLDARRKRDDLKRSRV